MNQFPLSKTEISHKGLLSGTILVTESERNLHCVLSFVKNNFATVLMNSFQCILRPVIGHSTEHAKPGLMKCVDLVCVSDVSRVNAKVTNL